LVIAGFVSATLSRSILVDRAGMELQDRVERVGLFLDGMLDEYEQILDAIATDPAVRRAFRDPRSMMPAEEAALYNTIYLLLAGKKTKPGIHVISTTGGLSLSTQASPLEYDPVKFAGWGLLRKAESARGALTLYAAGFGNRVGPRQTVSMAKLVENGNGADFYVILDLYRGHFEEIVDSLSPGKSLTIEVTDRNFIPLYAPGTEIPGNRLERFHAIADLEGSLQEIEVSDGIPLLLAHNISPGTGIRVFGTVTLAETLSGTSVGQTVFLLIGIATGILCLILAILIARNVSEPLYDIIRCVTKIHDGDFSARIRIARNDEIGELAGSINLMSAKIEELIDDEKKKERSLRLAELRTLQAQIQPHFIFNCLDLIKWNARLGKNEEVSGIVLQLGRLLRGSIRNTDEFVPLGDELRMIEDYLAIQKRRFEERLRVEVTIDSDLRDIMVPKFILQPIVENSLVHGLEGKMGTGTIRIKAERQGEALFYEIEDDGVGIDEATLIAIMSDTESVDAAGIGLRNIRRRLGLYYGDDQYFRLESIPGCGTKVSIRTAIRVKEYG